MSIKKTTGRELTLTDELERLRLLNRADLADPDNLRHTASDLAEAYGRLQGAVETACEWLEGRQPMMSRAEVASHLRGALARAEAAAKKHKP